MNRFNIMLMFLALCALTITPAVAEIPDASDGCAGDLAEMETTPSSEFTVVGDGSVVLHERTGLQWRRCPEGMDWNDGGCDGDAITRTWHDALEVAANAGDGWRLPSIEELRSIVEHCRVEPAINLEVFPGTSSSRFWSASPSAEEEDSAWFVNFNPGNDGYWYKSHDDFHFRVRLVRVGQ